MRVLLVDDDVEHLHLLGLAFRARGHEVEETSAGLGVIGRLAGWEAAPPDVCVLDNYLPAISGVAIVKLAARTKRAVDVPVLVYSSDANVGAAIADSGHPRAHFAVKDGRMRALVDRVEALVSP